MKTNHISGVLFICLMLYATISFCETPRLVKSIPADGATNVTVSQDKIILMFDRNMKMGSWSLMESKGHPFPPILPIDEPWIDPLTFEFQIKSLKPNTIYAIQLNGKKRKGFVASEDQSPLPVTSITFTTVSDVETSRRKDTHIEQQISHPEAKLPPPPTVENQLIKPIPINPGWRFKVTRSTGIDGTESYQSGEKGPVRFFQKVIFLENVLKADGNTIHTANREIESAQLHSLNPDTGQMVKQQLVAPGTTFRVSHTPYGTTLFDGVSGQEIWDTDIMSTFSPPLIPGLWPQGVLQVGQKWSYQGSDLTNRIALIEVLGGQIELQVDKIITDPSTGLETALISGRLRTKVDLDSIILDFDAGVEIALPLLLDVPLMIKFSGKLSGSGAIEDEQGQPVSFQFQADGDVLQVVQPSDAVINAVAGQVKGSEEKVDTKGALRIRLDGNMQQNGQDSNTIYPKQNKTPETTDSHPTGKGAPVYRYSLYEDKTEKAFTVLIPQGWQTEGGIMQISPNQIRTVVDGCGKKLHFSIYDPSSQAYITYFPTEIFHTASSGISGMPGQALNGMIQMPRVLSPNQYVSQVVFPAARKGASNVEWGKRKSLTELANDWNKAFHPEDPIPPRIIAESIEVAYDRSGTRFMELWTTLITSVTVQTSTVWMPDFAVVAGGPITQVEKMAPVLKSVITSFRMNPTWMANTMSNFSECTGKVAKGQEERRALARKISKRLMSVQKQIQKIDNEIVAGHDATRSSIQEHNYNTLMGNDTYEDDGTGNRYLIDMGYERNFTDGETIIQTDDWLFEPPPEYREMRNINITDD